MRLIKNHTEPVDLFKGICSLLFLASIVELARNRSVGGDDKVVLCQSLDILDSASTMIDVILQSARFDVLLDLLFPIGDCTERRYEESSLAILNQSGRLTGWKRW